ncbi:hypothetical protein RSOLAG1IB_04887 [Rhizoctonia solani AG-1 IB]|uniref:Cytochrome c oxidase assembly protein COX20, mitochondrial n=1 Tax=Thanatephorus cucumeris (strain AG1-IB / isolate 7/3/14) TaxID=1108050 RepID=A0A0B7FX66_THACB|nr:hypothetical protein RSOLAG1IB_04887 [Rhizoctonia solani AG-1 IB]
MSKTIDPNQGDADGTVTTPAAGTSRTLEAIKRIDPLQDFKRIPSMPCARESLLYGIGTGAGIGGIRFISSRSILTSCHWAVGTFILVSSFSWYTCRSALSKEQMVMRTIAERYPERNAKRLKRRDGPNPPSEDSTSSS